jgi:hypothetical protein
MCANVCAWPGAERRYVLQDDRLLATETVRETLTFAAKMRLPASTSAQEIQRRVNVVLGVRRLPLACCRMHNCPTCMPAVLLRLLFSFPVCAAG